MKGETELWWEWTEMDPINGLLEMTAKRGQLLCVRQA